MTDNLFELFRSRFPADRSRTFIEVPGGRAVSYGDLEAMSARYAHALAAAGVRPGDRVAVQVDKSAEAVVLYLACLRAGAVLLPLNTAYQAGELEYFLSDASPAAVVCQPHRLAELEGLAVAAGITACVMTLGATGDGTLPERAGGLAETFTTAPRGGDDMAAILYSSGTTGRPKGAMMSHANLGSNALTLHALWGFAPDDVLLHCLPIFHTHGLFVAINCVLLNGSAMIFCPKFDAEQAIGLLKRATVFMGVPTFYTRFLTSPNLTPEACSHMRLFISGSAPLLEETFNAFREKTGFTILERYGMTEGGMFTSNPLVGDRRAGTVGFPLPDVQLRITGEEGQVLPRGEVGIIEVKGPNIFKGYWNMPEKTKAEFTGDGFFKSGDVGVIDERGYVSIVGRAKDLIISGGYNVYPKEVEDFIDRLAGVVESAVIGMPHPDFGEAGLAVVVAEKGAALTAEGVIDALKGRLANYKVPKQAVVVAELPRNAMGKVQKNVLRDSYAEMWKASLQ
ncbi:malonyl-CoA synthase [Paramagnetospirillum caucaseum]|uniref:3-methylmercaptopropionyl-CoA ligase n=1 Tax=Paramagnetospirillum caucaseum TaxID=1244869 RepID=M2ZNT9_9PROT|nr:malonyl-CoA synthase [Paramagnetospirillum caucaseum]EME68977.1 malonyl-CoA synthase [Paramagnetospirillum caucaseum]